MGIGVTIGLGWILERLGGLRVGYWRDQGFQARYWRDHGVWGWATGGVIDLNQLVYHVLHVAGRSGGSGPATEQSECARMVTGGFYSVWGKVCSCVCMQAGVPATGVGLCPRGLLRPGASNWGAWGPGQLLGNLSA